MRGMQRALIETTEEADRVRLVVERVIRQISSAKVGGDAAKREQKLEEKLTRRDDAIASSVEGGQE